MLALFLAHFERLRAPTRVAPVMLWCSLSLGVDWRALQDVGLEQQLALRQHPIDDREPGSSDVRQWNALADW